SRENSTGNRVESKGTRRIESGAPPPHRTQKRRSLGAPELSARLQSKPLRSWSVSLRHVHLALAALFRFGLHVLPSASSHKLPDCGKYLSGRIIRGESNGENRKNCRPQEDDGHHQEHGLPEVRQADPHREAGERSRARYSGRHVHFVLGMRV